MYNLNYAPTTLGVQSQREIICGGTRTKKVEYHCSRMSWCVTRWMVSDIWKDHSTVTSRSKQTIFGLLHPWRHMPCYALKCKEPLTQQHNFTYQKTWSSWFHSSVFVVLVYCLRWAGLLTSATVNIIMLLQ